MTTQDKNFSRRFVLLSALAISTLAGTVYGSPEGGDVIEGEADIDYGDWTRVVTGEITVIEWLSFQIAAGETVEFIMPSESSRVLNLINSGVPTEIMGTLLGNGQIFLVNPSGVIFGQGAVVNVGALYAAAGNMATNDFVNGVYRFTDARGVVENRGLLQGDLIALVGGRVANHGTISAPGGTVVMAAGEQVLIGEHLGNLFVDLERPTDLANTDGLSDPFGEGLDLAAGDVFSLAAWNTGTIDAAHTTMAVSAGYAAIDHSIEAEDITLQATGDSYIELSADLLASGDGIFVDGDLVLGDDVMMTLTGDHGDVVFDGEVDSSDDAENNLFIDAGNGVVSFVGGVGQDAKLGVLDVTASRVQIHSDVSVNQEMNFYAPVEIMGDSTTFDVGMGTALFGDRIYSHIDGMSDVAFLYEGEAWVGNGEARTPYKFRNGIGQGPALSTNPVGGAFGNIQFGSDLNGPSRVSAFMFGTGAMAGLELMSSDSVDLGHHFGITARESIVMGNGQKMLSFGSLSLNAKGNGQTLIQVGDLNVLGDLRISSLGRQGGVIRILDRASGEVDYTGNEEDRTTDGLFDQGTELIASGSITLNADSLEIGSGGLKLGAAEVFLLNNLGDGDGAGIDIGLFPGGVSLDLFRGVLSGTGDLLYPYDLTTQAIIDPFSQAELATSFTNEDDINLRTIDPLIAGMVILGELSMNPRNTDQGVIREGLNEGGLRHIENNGDQNYLTMDRLSRKSVARLTQSYLALFGEVQDDSSGQRSNSESVQKAIGWLWIQTNEQDVDSVFAHAIEHDHDGLEILTKAKDVLNAIELLELTPREILRAKDEFLKKIVPNGVPQQSVLSWFAQ